MRPIHLIQIIPLNKPILLACNYLKQIISALVAKNKSNKLIQLLAYYVTLVAPFKTLHPKIISKTVHTIWILKNHPQGV